MQSVTIRKGSRKDSARFLKLVQALADFEHLDPPDSKARRRLVEDIFKRNRAKLFIASIGKRAVGYALYFYTYSSFLARPTLYLEDIFVLKEFRKKGIGYSLFLKLVKEARRNGCGRIELAVLTWNKNAIKFYEKLGARRLNEWHSYRLARDRFESLIDEKHGSRNQEDERIGSQV